MGAPRECKCGCRREWYAAIEAFHAALFRREVRKKRHSWNQLGVNGAISRPGAREKSIRSRRRLCDTDFRTGHWRRSITREKLHDSSRATCAPIAAEKSASCRVVCCNTRAISARGDFHQFPAHVVKESAEFAGKFTDPSARRSKNTRGKYPPPLLKYYLASAVERSLD